MSAQPSQDLPRTTGALARLSFFAVTGAIALAAATLGDAPAARGEPAASGEHQQIQLAQSTFVRQDVHYSDTIVSPPPIVAGRSCVFCKRTTTGTARQNRVVERHWYRAHAGTPKVSRNDGCGAPRCQNR